VLVSAHAVQATAGTAQLLYLFNDFSLDTARRELRCGDGLVPVELQVFDLLDYLIRNRDRVISREDLLASIWHGRFVSDSALTTRINAARAAIGDSGDAQQLIKTLPRKGVRFVGSVREDGTVRESAAAMPATIAQAAGLTPAREQAGEANIAGRGRGRTLIFRSARRSPCCRSPI
jgi:DNA-binding winged helix-turn-helix (wHTH) protein